MSLMRTLHGGAVAEGVRMPGVAITTTRDTTPCQAGIKLDADGSLYSMQANGSWSRFGEWRLAGASGDYYVVRTINSGTLDTDAGAGPLVLSTDRVYSISNASWDTTRETVITLVIENAATTDLDEGHITLSATLHTPTGGGGTDDKRYYWKTR